MKENGPRCVYEMVSPNIPRELKIRVVAETKTDAQNREKERERDPMMNMECAG